MGTYSPALARASKNALTGCSLQRAGYGENVLKIKRGDLLFLLNLDTNTLYGTFLAQSQGAKNLAPEAWKSRYPYQVEVSRNGTVHSFVGARKLSQGWGSVGTICLMKI